MLVLCVTDKKKIRKGLDWEEEKHTGVFTWMKNVRS